jgi:hypothetical protein
MEYIFNAPTKIDKQKPTWMSRWGNLYQKDFCSYCGVDIIICPHCDMGSCSGTSCDHCNDDFTEFLDRKLSTS